MKKIFLFLLFSFCFSKPFAQSNAQSRTYLFDNNWLFTKDNVANAEQADYNDSTWRALDLPHDWSIEDLPSQQEDSVQGPFSKASIGKMGTGYMIGGTAWYRKHFTINKADEGKTAYLQFDGVYMNSDVWVNGKHVGNHPYGYTSFWYNITPYLNPAGKPNIVAVQVKNEGMNARWYSGSGIYRHTWLTLVNPVHVAPWGVYITTPVVSDKKATVEVATNIINSGSRNMLVSYVVKLLNPSGVEVGKAKLQSSILAGQSTELKQNVAISNPALWSLEKPDLYRAQVELFVDNKMVDKVNQTFGIRTIHFDAQTGFTLNGKTVKLKGGCIHHDNGPLGAAAIDRAEERKIELIKKAGYNAIRCSHNPPSPYLLDVCDQLGILVIDEAFDMWEKSKMGAFGGKSDIPDYSKFFKEWWQKDIQSMVLRDRNHPSIIMWSIGNEILEAADTSGLRIATNLANEVRKHDSTRGVTEAHNDIAAAMGGKSDWGQRGAHFALLDVAGYNYQYTKYEADHQKYPERVMYASEFYPFSSLENWQAVEKLPYVIGAFSWTAMDYIGESGIGLSRLLPNTLKKSEGLASMMMFYNPNSWPTINAYCGDIDLIGNRKVASYYQNVVWRNSPIELLVHRPIPTGMREQIAPWGFPDELKCWTWPGQEGKKMQVHVYTRSKQVKLELNGKIIAEQTIPDSSITATFEVEYQPGTLVARGFDNEKEIGSSTLTTTGKPVAIRLVADRSIIKADKNDLSYVSAEIVDEKGNVVPSANDVEITYQLTGDGILAGVGNGNPTDVSSFQQNHKKVFQGKGLAIIRPKGSKGAVTLTASAPGLKDGITKISIK